MKSLIRKSILSSLLVLAISLPVASLADGHRSSGQSRRDGGVKKHSVPEFDVTTVGAIAAVIAGGGIVLARRRKS